MDNLHKRMVIQDMYYLAYYNGILVCVSEKLKYIEKYIKINRHSYMDLIKLETREYLMGEECDKEIISYKDRICTVLDFKIITQEFEWFMDEAWVAFNNIGDMLSYSRGPVKDSLEESYEYYKSIFMAKDRYDIQKDIQKRFTRDHEIWDMPMIPYLSMLEKIHLFPWLQ